MNQSELKACREAGITEFAVQPDDPGTKLGWRPTRYLPSGLTKAVVVEWQAEWIEQSAFVRGGVGIPFTRRNGVLIQYVPLKKDGTPAKRPAKKVIERTHVIVPWADYEALLAAREAEREKERARKKIGTDIAAQIPGAEFSGYRTDYDAPRKKNGRRPVKGYIKLDLDSARKLIERLNQTSTAGAKGAGDA